MPQASQNFAYLAYHDQRLVALGTQAEQQFGSDPSVCLIKLRLFGEVLAQRAAAKLGLYLSPDEKQIDLINRLWDEGAFNADVKGLFHDLRRAGNAAVHEGWGDHDEALHQLKMARQLAIWFQRTYGNNKKFDPGPFVPPKADKVDHVAELDRLRKIAEERASEIEKARQEVEAALKKAEQEAEARLTAEQEREIWESLSAEAEQERDKLQAQLADELAKVQATAVQAPKKQLAALVKASNKASDGIDIDEAATRRIIDKQLRDAGWEADSEQLRHERGVRPQKNRNLAIAEWPTKKGPADYVLFVGLRAIGIVEAKRKSKDIPGSIQQAKRYSRGFSDKVVDGGPWGEFNVPFLFATNGRPYLRQLKTKSGVWFLDARRRDNHPAALESWYTPDGLVDRLKQDVDAAHAALREEPTNYLGLRDYQVAAIKAIEGGLEKGQRELLVAMATGTGKTRTCIGLAYRLLKARRFRRVLFLVDRSALGHQAAGALKDVRLENLQTFTDIFDIKELGDIEPDPDTRMQLATVQSMVKRILGPHDDESEQNIPTVDQYDCIVVDECHRGYLLDREMSDRELSFRSEADYISKYRRVLDHFDAVKIGLTATPALHTSEIFGEPIYEYSYREAVVDGFLVDHEPPTRIVTKLAADGITWKAGEEMQVLDRDTHEIEKSKLADDVKIEVE